MRCNPFGSRRETCHPAIDRRRAEVNRLQLVAFGPGGGRQQCDKAGMGAWLDACAETTRDKPWSDAKAVAIPGGGTCGSALDGLIKAYRAKVRGGATFASRIDERVGDPKSPLHKLVSPPCSSARRSPSTRRPAPVT